MKNLNFLEISFVSGKINFLEFYLEFYWDSEDFLKNFLFNNFALIANNRQAK